MLVRKAKHKRLAILIFGLFAVSAGVGLIANALNENIVFFRTPGDLVEKPIGPGLRFRLGGLVADGSVERNGQATTFVLTDGADEITVTYLGLLPDLFREGQGVVTEGALNAARIFEATTVLAKHDENYMPPEVAAALKDKGLFQHAAPDRKNLKGGSSYD